jgi:ABC-type transporter MlaC component
MAAASDDSVRNFVDRMNDASTALLSSESNALRCRRLLGGAFDVPGMARHALGKAWDQSTSAERQAFLAALRIVDVSIDGRGALHTERQDYAEILDTNHGDIYAAIAFVRRRARNGS